MQPIMWSGFNSNDLERPNVARVYDYYLGGTAHFAVDRVFGEKVLKSFPFVRAAAMSNRLFLHRAVRYLVKRGIRQFIDIGSGVPTMGCTHQVAEDLCGDARVVYVDCEPVAVMHSQILLDKDRARSRHAVVQADLREPRHVWDKVAATGVIDVTRPLALMLLAVLHVAQPGPDGSDLAPAAVAAYRKLMPAGSYLAISHGTADGVPATRAREMAEFGSMYDNTPTAVTWRGHEEIEAFFGDFELVEPGATWTPLWHPEENSQTAPRVTFDDPTDSAVWAGIARKP